MTNLAALSTRTLALLRELQYGSDHPTLLFTQDPTGLGSQISRRLVGLRLALFLRRKVVFPSLAEPPYGQVFEAIHSNIDYASASIGAADFFSDGAMTARIVKLNFWDMWDNSQLRDQVYSYLPEGLSGGAEAALYLDGMLLTFCRLTRDHSCDVSDAAIRLNVDENTLGVHIRRGDKYIETPLLPIELINQHVGQCCATKGFRRVFACSDDPGIFDKLRVPAGVELVFDETERRYNNANHRFLMRNPELSSQETRSAVKNIFLLGRCGAIVGQSNAQFAKLAASQICFRTGGEYGVLIDANHVLEGSRAARAVHRARSGLRSIARTMFPWATIRHLKQRPK